MMLLDWPGRLGVKNVRALSTDRFGGVSRAPFDSLNMGYHVGDAAEAVAENRRRMVLASGGETRFVWLKQVHGTAVVDAVKVDAAKIEEAPQADAAIARSPGVGCVVMSADCLPVLFCDRAGSVVGAAHAGWRGLLGGVLEATVEAMEVAPGELLCWMGPAIGPESFEVGDEVRRAFLMQDRAMAAYFRPSPKHPVDRWMADLYGLARWRLRAAGVVEISGGGVCTMGDERYFSYRREGRTGRMATAIWLG